MEEVNGLRRREEDDDDDEAVTLWFLKSVDRNRDAILASLLNLEAMSIAMIVLFRIRRRLVLFSDTVHFQTKLLVLLLYMFHLITIVRKYYIILYLLLLLSVLLFYPIFVG